MTNAAAHSVKLNQANLTALPPNVRIPTYDRRSIIQSIVHIGVGGFYRAHQAVYLDELLHDADQRQWGYCGVNLLKHDARMRDVLQAQEGLYTVIERSAAGDWARVIGSMPGYLYAPDNPEAVLEKMAAPACRIVTLTITEGGYYVNEGTGAFNADHPDIVHDLTHPHAPTCSFGYLAEALDRRRQRGLAPFTVMSCDNLQHNGDVAKKMLLAFAERRDPALSTWLAEYGAFPNSMVDRITPATTDEHRLLVREKFAINDAWPVVTEPFTQWVIEDYFPHGRPAWERVGAQMTTDVLPYEKMKMRLLNASHQAMCYIGMLLGYQYAHEVMADPQIRTLVQQMMDSEVTPLLDPVPGVNLSDYKATLIERFSNPTIKDQLLRIGTEGSARIPKFVLPSIREQLRQGGPSERLCFTVAAWFRYLAGSDDAGRALAINDPLEQLLRERAQQGGRDAGALLGLRQLFGELSDTAAFVTSVQTHLTRLYAQGSRAALAHVIGD